MTMEDTSQSKDGNKSKNRLFPSFTKNKITLTINYILKLQRIPAHIAEPITPEELQAIACINK